MANDKIDVLYGTIIDINSKEYLCHIKAYDSTGRGYNLEDVPFLSRSIGRQVWSGSTDMPERLSSCLVLRIDRVHYVLDCQPAIKNLQAKKKKDNTVSITQTEPDAYTPGFDVRPDVDGARSFRFGANNSRPHDILPGDKIWKTKEGSFFGVLRGGLVIARVNEFCQMMMSKVDSIFRIVSRNFQLFTDWGRCDVINDENKTNLYVGAGRRRWANKLEDFRMEFNAGHIGDLINLDILDIKDLDINNAKDLIKKVIARFHIANNGKVDVYSSEGVTHSVTNRSVITNTPEIVSVVDVLPDSVLIRHGQSTITLDHAGNIFIQASNDVYITGNTVQIN